MIYNENGVIMNNDNIISLIESSIQSDIQDYIYESEILKDAHDKLKRTFKSAKEKVLQFVEFMKKKINEFSEFIQSKIRSIIPNLNEKRIKDNYKLMKHVNPKAIVKDTNYNNQQEFEQILLKEMPQYVLSVGSLQLIIANESNDEEYFDRFNKAADEICIYMANNFTAGNDLYESIEGILYKNEKSAMDRGIDKVFGKSFFDKDFDSNNISINTARKSVDDIKKIDIDSVINKVKSVDKLIPSIKSTNRQLDRMKKEVNKYDDKNDLTHDKLDYKIKYDENEGRVKKIYNENYNSLYKSIVEIYNFGADLIKYIKKCMQVRIGLLICLSSSRLTRWLKSAA